MDDNIKLNRELILKNPNLSANQLYNKSKSLGIGFRKTNFFGLVREVRDLPEPSIEKKERSIPIIYRDVKPKPIKPSKIKYPTKEGQYGIIEIDGVDINGDKITKWIKYNNKKDFNNQLAFVKEKYQIETFSIIPHGIHSYTEFIDQEFKIELENLGIFL